VPTLSPRPRLSDFFQGVGVLGRAFRLIFRSRRLFLLSSLCAVLTAIALVALAVLLYRYAPGLLESVWARPESWYGRAGWDLALILGALVAWVVGANVVPPLLLTPLQDPLSEATEAECAQADAVLSPASFLRGMTTGLLHTLARMALLFLGLAVLLPLNLVPGLGSIAFTVLASVWTMLWMAAEHLAAPMTRHLYPFAQVRRMLRERQALCLGFGAGVYLLLWVPILNTFFLPVAIVGGTLLYRGLREAGDLPPPPDALGPASPSSGGRPEAK
ncbi:sulfate transporter, partial [Corallococcus exercitus]|uniref:EI24 domain-containing protein n=2 Tax=Corallococcus exercitus TaxID=2316736 RepID=UPI000EA2EC71